MASWLARAKGIQRELVQTRQKLGSPQYGWDVLSYRAMRVAPSLRRSNSIRRIRLQDGKQIAYRRNRGDIQSIREVFLDESYRLPDGLCPRCIIDLGANIGLTSVWLTGRYPVDQIIAVEPVPENVELLRCNLTSNDVPAIVVEAAVGPQAGEASFTTSPESNQGKLGPGDLRVRLVTMPELLRVLGSRVDLLKLDIEGGEQALLAEGDLSWLDEVDTIIAEFHPTLVDYPRLTRIVADHGFRYCPAGTLWPDSMDIFIRT
jgi:FkbM family methyltransferase